jgi:hypothetical protein
MKLFGYFNDFIKTAKQKQDSEINLRLSNTVLELMNLLMDSLIILCDNYEGFYNYSKLNFNFSNRRKY